MSLWRFVLCPFLISSVHYGDSVWKSHGTFPYSFALAGVKCEPIRTIEEHGWGAQTCPGIIGSKILHPPRFLSTCVRTCELCRNLDERVFYVPRLSSYHQLRYLVWIHYFRYYSDSDPLFRIEISHKPCNTPNVERLSSYLQFLSSKWLEIIVDRFSLIWLRFNFTHYFPIYLH